MTNMHSSTVSSTDRVEGDSSPLCVLNELAKGPKVIQCNVGLIVTALVEHGLTPGVHTVVISSHDSIGMGQPSSTARSRLMGDVGPFRLTWFRTEYLFVTSAIIEQPQRDFEEVRENSRWSISNFLLRKLTGRCRRLRRRRPPAPHYGQMFRIKMGVTARGAGVASHA